MSTSATTTETITTQPFTNFVPDVGEDLYNDRPNRPRVWLVGGCRTPDPDPCQLPVVRDSLGHVWWPRDDGRMHMTAAGQHHADWHELRARYDLVEVA